MENETSQLGWLIVGHGTRDETGQAEFLSVVQQVTARVSLPVEACFLELAEPTIAAGLQRLAERNVRRVIVVPLLLFAAGHAKQDVPEAVFAAADELGLQIIGQASPLEFHPQLLTLSRIRVQQACDDLTARETILLLVGRGNSDPLAIKTVREYTQRLATVLQLPGETAFVAAAEPKLPEKLAELAIRKPTRVIILPHLLFAGEVFHTIQKQVALITQQHPDTQWLLADYLGPDPLLADAILDRAQGTCPFSAQRERG